MAMWNVACAIQTTIWVKEGKLPAELLDVPFDPRLFPFESIAAPAPPAPPPITE
jgi:hypothetical protein